MKTSEIASLISGELDGPGDVEIEGVAEITSAKRTEIAFLAVGLQAPTTNAGCVIIGPTSELVAGTACIRVTDPKLGFAMAAGILDPPKQRPGEIHPTAVIAEPVSTGSDVFVGPGVSIGINSSIGDRSQVLAGSRLGDNVVIGKDCLIGPNVVIGDRSRVGDRVIIHAGVVIGTDGFGFVRDGERFIKFPQIGVVVIEDDVEIGANTCIDRGALGETRIGKATKIDNLVHIAHNVRIGERVLIAGQSGIAGSSVIEDDVVIAGQVGISDHVTVRRGAMIGAKSAVFPNKVVRPGFWAGIPIREVEKFKRQMAAISRLESLASDIEELKKDKE